MTFEEFQAQAPETAKLDIRTDAGKVELVLALTSEVGSVARIYKKLVRDGVSLGSQSEQLKEELGDILWYVAMIAESMSMSLTEIADANLRRTNDRYRTTASRPEEGFENRLEDGYEDSERFPRRTIFELRESEREVGGVTLPHVDFSIVFAEPNHFPDGKIEDGGKGQGFTIGACIGDPVNDNAARDDGYRFHDAVHIGFMAVLGWSPVMRELLRLKRKSKGATDRVQDGARASDLEEALSALLKELSEVRNNFAAPEDIDGEVKDIIRRVIGNLEVSAAPLWLWEEAILQGYAAMNSLREHRGGWLEADLDERRVTFHQTRPSLLDG